MRARDRQDPLLGSVLHNYRIEALIGEGSAARVYRARHLFLDRLSAVKVLLNSSIAIPGLEERFKREARALATMSHANVVSVFDFGIAPDGRPFLTMELLSGQTLAEVIATEGPLDRWRIQRIARQLAAGLAEAHRHRIVHRDLKPANIMLLGDGPGEIVKILDFGVARATGPREKELTGFEVIIGTPRYMAPEQVMNPTCVSPATDLYSLGVVLYEMIAGRAPFQGGVMEVLDQQMNHLPPPLPSGTGLERLVFQLLSKRPDERPPAADTVIRSLDLLPDQAPTRLDGMEFRDRTDLMLAAPAIVPDTLIEEATVRDDPTQNALDIETMFEETAPGITSEETVDGLMSATLMLPQAKEPAPEPPKQPSAPKVAVQSSAPKVVVRVARPHDRVAAVLACIALVLGCSVVALAAVSAQRRLEPQVVVVRADRP